MADFSGTVSVIDRGGEFFIFNIQTEEAPYLIGQGGQNLMALQQLIRAIVGKKMADGPRFIVDVNGYQQDRLETLKSLALDFADEAKRRGQPKWLSPMNSYERRVVHMALADMPGIVTESEGEGETRRVVIRPKE
ncbi:MAG: SpoIIIJ-associated RNA-binding protein [Parcubacteria group bacterium GW2011_GWC2_42_6]|nr:MAG: SpoIIIJ-associated RNA-binding protein [Parcubacteria group bacterium GW2011_GWC2_42_6]